MEGNLHELKRMVIKIVDSGKELFDQNQAIILLNSISQNLQKKKNVLQYGKHGLKFNTMVFVLRTKDSKLKKKENK